MLNIQVPLPKRLLVDGSLVFKSGDCHIQIPWTRKVLGNLLWLTLDFVSSSLGKGKFSSSPYLNIFDIAQFLT